MKINGSWEIILMSGLLSLFFLHEAKTDFRVHGSQMFVLFITLSPPQHAANIIASIHVSSSHGDTYSHVSFSRLEMLITSRRLVLGKV